MISKNHIIQLLTLVIVFSLLNGCLRSSSSDRWKNEIIYSEGEGFVIISFSNDNSKIFLIAIKDYSEDKRELISVDVDTREIETLYTYSNRISSVQITPDETGFIYNERIDGHSKIYHYSFQTGNISDLGFGNSPDLSPDGSKIVYYNDSGIELMDIDGRNVIRLVENSYRPHFFPDGNSILFLEREGSYNISRMKIDGSQKQSLFTPDLGAHEEMMISYDGDHILFGSEYQRDETYMSYITYLYQISTEKLIQIDFENENRSSFSFHPSKPILTFTNKELNTQNSPIEIGVMDFNGNQITLISKDGVDERSIFSPDGKMIAYYHNDDWGSDMELCIAHDPTGEWKG